MRVLASLSYPVDTSCYLIDGGRRDQFVPGGFLVSLLSSHTCDLSVIEDAVALVSLSNLFLCDTSTATPR